MPNIAPEITAEDYLRQTAPFDPVVGEQIEVIPPLRTPEMELEAFMHEMVTVMVHESTDENSTLHVEVTVNGKRIIIPRGVNFPIKRMYVERLARAKRITYQQDLDPRLGEGVNAVRRHRGFDYPFSVLEDPNPRGAEWLKRVLAEA